MSRKVTLTTTADQMVALAEAANAKTRGGNAMVRVNQQALINLMLDQSRLIAAARLVVDVEEVK